MNWRRGLWRLWVVLSIVWVLASTLWVNKIANDEHSFFIAIKCYTEDPHWAECAEKYSRAASGNTWFVERLNEGYWIVIAVPPVLGLALGAPAFGVLGWVVRGFRRRPER